MKILACIVMALMPLTTAAQVADWSPTPLVINVPDWVHAYHKDTKFIFSTSGRTAQVWLVIETYLDDEDKPVAIANGYKQWHFVNKIDTTVYVSSSKMVEPGNNHIFEWDGYGNEKEYDVLTSNDRFIDYGIYHYYIWGYDPESPRELASDVLPIGHYDQGQYLRFYVYDDQGIPYPTPMIMGQVPSFQIGTTPMIDFATIVKWQLGNDPTNDALLDVSHIPGFGPNEVTVHPDYDPITNPTANYRVGYGPGVFDPQDHDLFYFAKNEYWNQRQTVVKYRFIPGGTAEMDSSWGDWENLEWFHPGAGGENTKQSGVMCYDEDYLVMLDGGTYPPPLHEAYDRIRILDKQYPTLTYWDRTLNEFYMPNQPDHAGEPRTSAEVNSMGRGGHEDTFILTGDMSCLTECISISRMIDIGSSNPYAEDGTGWVTWANSNGDYFLDTGAIYEPDHPELNWACIVSDPKSSNYPRREITSADRNGFTVAFVDYCGLNSFGIFCPDGTGIALAKFADDTQRTGGDDLLRPKGGGELLDYGGTYDGLYMLSSIPASSSITDPTYYYKTSYVAFAADDGLFEVWGAKPDAVDEPAPEPFTSPWMIPRSCTVHCGAEQPEPVQSLDHRISFTLTADGPVTIDVRNIAGQKVDTLVDGDLPAGEHSVVWNAGSFAAGTYFYTVAAGGQSRTMKMTLVK